ncbi:MAG: HD domain-containing phosphohydrolase, partial [Blastocatellia bacterium]
METAKGKTREEIINRLADRIDSYEKYTHPHSRLIAELATKLAHRFGLATPDVDAIAEAAMLHDIGLYAMAPAYHAVPRPLSFDARLDLWRHPVIGEQQMAKRDAMRHAQLLVRWHHEWWNGYGYPDMLAFEDIPIGARILRAVELYAALICDRPYRAALDQQQAREALTSSAGVECDPYVTKALVALLDELRAGIDEPASETSLNAPAREVESNVRPVEAISVESPAVESAPTVQPAVRSTSDLWISRGISSEGNVNPETTPSSQTGGSGEPADASQLLDIQTNRQASLDVTESHRSPAALQSAAPVRPAVKTDAADVLLSRAQSIRLAESDSNSWRGWKGSRYNKK